MPFIQGFVKKLIVPGKPVALFGMGCLAVLCLLALDDDLKVQHDSGVYITLGKSLASGLGYREIYRAGHPPHTTYPPVFPTLLAPVIFAFGYHVLAMKLLLTAIAVAALYLLYIFMRDLSDDRMASVVVVFTATSHGLLFYAQSIMAEMPYLFFSLLALCWLHRWVKSGEWSNRREAMAMAVTLIALPYLTRLIGLSLLLAVVAYLVCETSGRLAVRIKRAMLLGGLAAIPALLWFGRNWWLSKHTATAYVSGYFPRVVYGSRSTAEGLLSHIDMVYTNLYKYAVHTGRVIFFNAPWVSETFLPLLLAAVVLAGFLWCAVRRRTIVEYYVFFYMGGVLPFHGLRPQRYLVPLIPFICYYFFIAVLQGFSWIQRKSILRAPVYQQGAMAVATFLLVCLLTANGAAAVWGNLICSGREGYYHVMGEEGYVNVVPWVTAHTPPESIFAWAKPSLRFIRTERKGINYPQTRQMDDLLRFLYAQYVDYVVTDSFSKRTQWYLGALVEHYPEHFRLVYEDEVSKVYKVAVVER